MGGPRAAVSEYSITAEKSAEDIAAIADNIADIPPS
jgi:hypothetical protein